MAIQPGFSGNLKIGDTQVACTSFSVTPEQQPLYYNHTYGLRDSGGGDSKGDGGALNPQRGLWRPSTKLIRASFSYIATNESGNTLYEAAKKGDDINGVFSSDCNNGYSLSECKVSTFNMSVTAGDLLNISGELVGSIIEAGGEESVFSDQRAITWDQCNVSVSGGGSEIYSFELSINNNCIPIYTSGTNKAGLFPHKIRIGIQEVTGNIGFYSRGMSLAWIDSASPVAVSFSAGSISASINAILNPITRTGSVTPAISTVTFNGIGKSLGG